MRHTGKVLCLKRWAEARDKQGDPFIAASVLARAAAYCNLAKLKSNTTIDFRVCREAGGYKYTFGDKPLCDWNNFTSTCKNTADLNREEAGPFLLKVTLDEFRTAVLQVWAYPMRARGPMLSLHKDYTSADAAKAVSECGSKVLDIWLEVANLGASSVASVKKTTKLNIVKGMSLHKKTGSEEIKKVVEADI